MDTKKLLISDPAYVESSDHVAVLRSRLRDWEWSAAWTIEDDQGEHPCTQIERAEGMGWNDAGNDRPHERVFQSYILQHAYNMGRAGVELK
jgi:hypothetical protein